MHTFRKNAVTAALAIGGAFALMFVAAHPSATAENVMKVAGFFPPALPSAWEKSMIERAGQPAVVFVSDAVPLKAYEGIQPYMAIIGHIFSPKGAAKSTVMYGYDPKNLTAIRDQLANLADGAIVFANQGGGYNGYMLSGGTIDQADVGAAMMDENFLKTFAAKYGEKGKSVVATTKKFKGIPIAIRLAVNTDSWIVHMAKTGYWTPRDSKSGEPAALNPQQPQSPAPKIEKPPIPH